MRKRKGNNISSRDHSGDYDLYIVSEKLSDHITDEIFSHLVERRSGDGDEGDLELVEDLDTDLRKAIKSELIPTICKTAVRRIGERVEDELKEQYHAGTKYETAADTAISGARWIMAFVYMLLALSLVSILIFTFVDTKVLLHASICYVTTHLKGGESLNECRPVQDLMTKAGYEKSKEELEKEFGSVSRGDPANPFGDWLALWPGFPFMWATTPPPQGQPQTLEDIPPKDRYKKSPDSLSLVIAPVVKLLDLVLIGSLVVMVLIGGYENTVSRIGMKHSLPVWLGKLTISELKVKVAASIVIISSIHLLMEFLKLDFPKPSFLGDGASDAGEAASWLLYIPLIMTSVIHLVFIFSALAITHINRLESELHAKASGH